MKLLALVNSACTEWLKVGGSFTLLGCQVCFEKVLRRYRSKLLGSCHKYS